MKVHRHPSLERRLSEASRPSLGDGLRTIVRELEDEAAEWSSTRYVRVDLRAVRGMSREQKAAYYRRNARHADRG